MPLSMAKAITRSMKKSLLTGLLTLTLCYTVPLARAADEPKLEENPARKELNTMIGKPAPAISLKEWTNSKPLTLADLKGKIVLVDFWATWCGPRIAAVPHNNEMMKKYADKGVVIIGVCAANGAEKMAETVKAKGIEYPVAVDTNDTVRKAYKGNSFPDYYIIDRAGNLRWADVVNTDAEKAIQILLKEDKK